MLKKGYFFQEPSTDNMDLSQMIIAFHIFCLREPPNYPSQHSTPDGEGYNFHHPEADDDFRHPTFLCRDTEFRNRDAGLPGYHEEKGMKGVVQVMVKYTPDILHVMETQNCSIKRLVFKFQCIIFVVVVVGIYFKFPGYKNGVPGMMKMCIKDWT